MLIAPLLVRDALYAVMVVAVPGAVPAATTRTVEALSAQAALALESATLTEELLLKQSEARFASLVRNASDVVTVVEIDTTITYVSPSSLRTLGYTSGDLEGTRFIDLVHDEDKTRAMSFLTSGEGDDAVATLEFRVRRRDGSMIFAETLAHEPAARRERQRHRPHDPRRQRAQGVRGAAVAPGVPRLADRTGEPRAVPRPRDARPGAPGARPATRVRPVHGPRRLQDDQRLARARRRRRVARRGRRAAPAHPAGARHRGAPRRRRVRGAARGQRRPDRRGRRCRAADPGARRRRSTSRTRRCSSGRASGSRSRSPTTPRSTTSSR